MPIPTLDLEHCSSSFHTAQPALRARGTSQAIGYTPDANYNGPDSFVVQVSDSASGTDTITVSVPPFNGQRCSRAEGDPKQTVTKLHRLSFTATATDIDVPADALTFSLVECTVGASD